MKKLFVFFVIISNVLISSAPSIISWQGILTDENGDPLSGSHRITVNIYDNEAATQYIWTETQTVYVVDGLVNLILGETESLNISFDVQYWLEITVDSGNSLPRIKLTSVPYAVTAKNVDDGSITYNKLQNATGNNGTLIKWNGSSWIEGSETDPVFSSSASSGITNTSINHWNTAYGWGDHSEAGYLTVNDENDPTWTGSANPSSDIGRTGNTGIGTEEPGALLHVSGSDVGEGNVLFEGSYKWGTQLSPQGDPPVEGSGTRMMWYPDKAAFRAGTVGNNWDKDSIGLFTFAAGYNPMAKGRYSISLGYGTNATGSNSVAFGYHTVAEGEWATALGSATSAVGWQSTAMGRGTNALSTRETVIGSFNTDYEPSNHYSWNSSDRLFVIGNGTDFDARSDALVMLKNGNTGFGTSNPGDIIHVNNSTSNARVRISAGTSALSSVAFYGGNNFRGSIGTNNSEDYMFIYHAGNIYFKYGRIGIQSVSSPTYAIQLPNSTANGTGKALAYQWVTYSDGRLKSDRKEIVYGLNEILQIKPLSYIHHNSEFENGNINILNEGNNDFGFIAQDMYKIIPEMVSKPEDDTNELWGINYEKLTPVLVKAIQEQQLMIEEQKENVFQLEEKLNSQNDKIEEQNIKILNYEQQIIIQKQKIEELDAKYNKLIEILNKQE